MADDPEEHPMAFDVSVTSSFGSPIMFNPKRGLEASAGVLKDILLGNHEDSGHNESFHSNGDFEDLHHFQSFHPVRPTRPVMKRPGQFYHSSLDLRRVGSQMSRPHSHSPARVPTRRYSPPQGSTGSNGTKSPDSNVTPKTSWEHGPISTSSPMTARRFHSRPPYYVSDTQEDSLEGATSGHHSLFIDHMGPCYPPPFSMRGHNTRPHPFDISMVRLWIIFNFIGKSQATTDFKVHTVWLTYPFDSTFCNFVIKKGTLKAIFIIKW